MNFEYQSDLTFTQPRQRVQLSTGLKNIVAVWLREYVIRGVPVMGNGAPTYSQYYLRMGPMPMPPRITSSTCATDCCIPLTLTGEYTVCRCENPILVNSGSPASVAAIDFQLLLPDGSPAIFDSCTVQLTIVVYKDEHSLGDAYGFKPKIVADSMNQRARPVY